ncbi:MAG: hypothetical protein ACRECQ_00405 [Burkholderiaceae bacterium]
MATDPSQAGAYYNRAVTRSRLGKLTEAEAATGRCLCPARSRALGARSCGRGATGFRPLPAIGSAITTLAGAAHCRRETATDTARPTALKLRRSAR